MKKTPTAQSFYAGKNKIAVVGLGYVGLPLAVHLSRHFTVVGYTHGQEDTNAICAARKSGKQ